MRKTIFAGLTVLDPDESLFTDNGSFQGRDRDEIDRALQLGVKLHRHTGLPGLVDPNVAPAASVTASGGTIDAGQTITVGYTLEDSNGGETLISPLAVTTTPVPLDGPLYAPSGVADYTGGDLLTDTYFYAYSFIDANGGETPIGPTVTVERSPGFPNARINLSQIGHGMAAQGATGWRLYRARGGGEYVLLTTGSIEDDTFVDDGSVSPDCDTHPPTDNQNTTGKINTLDVTLPAGGVITPATFINLYASLSGDFGESSLLAQYPVASAGQTVHFTALSFLDAQPPDVNRSYGGANQIDPDSELLDWHWKRPVANAGALPSGTQGDVRVNLATGNFHLMLRNPSGTSAQWTTFSGGGGGSGVTVNDEGVEVLAPAAALNFVGIGVTVTDNLDGTVNVSVPGQEGRYASGTVRAVEETGQVHLTLDPASLQFAASGAASVGVEDIGGGSARITIGAVDTFGVGGGGVTLEVKDADPTSVTPAASIDFRASGAASVDVTSLGGGSARVMIGAPQPNPLDVSDADGTLVPDIGLLDFRASGGAAIDVTSLGGGSARVMIAAPLPVAPMAPSALIDVTDVDTTVPDAGQIDFRASGKASVDVTNLGGGSARVTIAAAPADYPVAENWHTVGDPGEPAFASAWTHAASGFANVAFRREGDVIRLRGVAVRPAVNGPPIQDETIFTLPDGFRPPSRVTVQGLGGRLDVLTDGRVIFVGGEAYQGLDQIAFSTVTVGGSASVGLMQRRWASAIINLASGASGNVDFTGSAAGGRLLGVAANRRSRIRLYGDQSSRTADLLRAMGTDPTGDHGVLLDYALTAMPSGAQNRMAPAVDVHNLDSPVQNKQYLNVTNYDATGNVVVAFLYLPTEIV